MHLNNNILRSKNRHLLLLCKGAYLFLIILLCFFLIGWTSKARRYQQGNKSPRQTYMSNKRVEGKGSRTTKAMRHIRNYNGEFHLGPSQILIRSRSFFCVNCREKEDEKSSK